MTGPTTTGSIDAKLTIDKSAWDRKAEEAKKEAKELGALSPEIKVDANVGPALAKLEAVAKAERDLDNAYQRSAISQEKLDAVTNKYGEDSVQAASARLTHKRAIDSEEAAEAKLAAAKAKSTVEQDKNTESVNRGHEANRRYISGVQVLIALSPAILSAAAPIAAAAVGLAGAFAGMAGAGVAAVFGIKHAMEDGTAAGNKYAAGIGVLKADMAELAQTSAVAMLGSFSTGISNINQKMPFLNRLLSEQGAILGGMGSGAVRDLLFTFERMNPLLQQGGVELGKFVQWLFAFSGSNGFSDFIKYASNALPGVMHLIESLVTLAGNLLSAFAPLGPGIIAALTAISDGLNSLPLPVLAGLVTTAVAIAPALRIAGAAMGLFAIESQLAVPVVGLLTAALAGIIIGVASANANIQEGTAALTMYTQALKDDKDAIGEHVQATAAKALADAKAFDSARELGISQYTLTQAVLGNKNAIEQVNAAVQKGREFVNDWSQGVVDANTGIYQSTTEQNRMGKAIDVVTGQVKAQSGAIEAGKQQNIDFAEATKQSTGALDSQSQAAQLNANQYGTSVAAYQSATSAQDAAKVSTDNQTLAMQLQNNAAGLLKQALDGLNGKALNAAQAQNAFDSSLANMGTHVDKVGKTIKFTTANIGDMSSASVALRGQLNGQISALQQTVEANGGLDESTGKAREQMESMRTQIIDNAVAHGVDKDAVTAYVDNLLKIPASVPPTKVDIDKAEAELKLQGFQLAINSLTGKTVQVYAEANIASALAAGDQLHANSMAQANSYATGAAYRSEGGPIYRSSGGPVNYLAGGGSPFVPKGTDTVAAMLTPGEFVMRRASAQAIGPAALNHMNSTGQMPPNQGNVTVNLILDGDIIDTRVVDLANMAAAGAISQANRDAQRRPSR